MNTFVPPRYKSNRLKGFTLIEILVVLVLLGLISSIAVVSVGMNNQNRELENEIRRIHSLMRFAADESVLQNIELGFYIDSESYEFLEYEEEGNSWIAVADPELRPRNLPEWVSVELTRDDDIKELPVPEDSEEKKPLLVFFSSGESTEFTLSFFVDGAGKSGYEISSNGYQAIALITPENPDEP